jgi:hypothetical protein
LDKIDQQLLRLNKIEQRLETLEQNTAAEFKAVRGEIMKGREETAAEFKTTREDMYQYYSQLDNKIETRTAEFQRSLNMLLTGMDPTARDLDMLRQEKVFPDNELDRM